MFCQQCHTMLRDDAKFCTSCGSKQEGISLLRFHQSTPLSRFPSWHEELLACARSKRLDRLEEILKNINEGDRVTFYTIYAKALFDRSMHTLCQPHRSFSNNVPKGFDDARRCILSKDREEREKGLAFFSRKVPRPPSSSTLMYEWLLFARASVYGPEQVVSEWSKKWKAEDASWEEIWNLAVCYVLQADFQQALEILRPGIDRRRAPFTHLRFALYCAMQSLIQRPSPSDEHEVSADFLRADVYKWPQLECYIVWLLLKIQKGSLQETTDPNEPIAICKTLDHLLTHPIVIPDPENIVEEKEAQSFTEHLERLGFTETLIFWLNSYTKCHYTKFGRSGDEVSAFKRSDFERWHKASTIYERAGNHARAEQILYDLAREQQKIFLKQRKGNGAVSADAFPPMRERLMDLFAFYQRHGMLREEPSFERFVKFYERIPEVWEDSKGRNKKLVELTQALLTKWQQSQLESEVASRSTPAEKSLLSNPSHLEFPVRSRSEVDRRVGLFVDLENVTTMLQGAKVENVGAALLGYATQLGGIACRWVTADLRNLGESMHFLTQLKRAGFQPRYPRDEPQTGKAEKKAADFALIETIHYEKCNTTPDIYIIVSGDKDFYECIVTLIESGATVRLCASLSRNHIAEKYKRLESERRRIQLAKSRESDFFIDDLDCVLKGTSTTKSGDPLLWKGGNE
jgi:hypothetical protein